MDGNNRQVGFADRAFPMPPLNRARFEFLLPKVNGFRAYDTQADHDAATNLLSNLNLLHSKLEMYKRKYRDCSKPVVQKRWQRNIIKTQRKIEHDTARLSQIPVQMLLPDALPSW